MSMEKVGMRLGGRAGPSPRSIMSPSEPGAPTELGFARIAGKLAQASLLHHLQVQAVVKDGLPSTNGGLATTRRHFNCSLRKAIHSLRRLTCLCVLDGVVPS